jgi:hypothetical protein
MSQSTGDAPPTSRPKSDFTETSQPRLRTGRDGRTINTARIGEKQRRKVQRPRSPAEFAAARREGYRGRLASMVKLELPNNHVANCAFDLLRYFTFEYLQKVFVEITRLHQERQDNERNS